MSPFDVDFAVAFDGGDRWKLRIRPAHPGHCTPLTGLFIAPAGSSTFRGEPLGRALAEVGALLSSVVGCRILRSRMLRGHGETERLPAGTAATPTAAATRNATSAPVAAASRARRSAAAAAACPNGGPWLAHYIGLVLPSPLYKLDVQKKNAWNH